MPVFIQPNDNSVLAQLLFEFVFEDSGNDFHSINAS
jgi:hypothetical protein